MKTNKKKMEKAEVHRTSAFVSYSSMSALKTGRLFWIIS